VRLFAVMAVTGRQIWAPVVAMPGKARRAQAIGRSRGGLTTKIHALVDALGNPVQVMLSVGQDHDLTCAEPLIEAVSPGALIADKVFDADTFIATLDTL
jgi:Transposase DDE domain